MIRLLLLLLIALLSVTAPAAAQNGGGGNIVAPVNVKVLKPLQLARLRDLDFGTIAMRPFAGTQMVSVRPSGRTCGSGGLLVCSGTFATARFRVTGTNRERVLLSSPTTQVLLRNPAGATLTMVPQIPSSVTMPNSGNQGVVFEVGGELQIPSTAKDGLYTGIIEIVANYQ